MLAGCTPSWALDRPCDVPSSGPPFQAVVAGDHRCRTGDRGTQCGTTFQCLPPGASCPPSQLWWRANGTIGGVPQPYLAPEPTPIVADAQGLARPWLLGPFN